MNKKLKGLTLMLIAPIILMACGKEEPPEVEPIPEPESQEEIDMEQFRVKGDRVKDAPVLETESRQERLIQQYETVDRPIIMNTIRYIKEFDDNHKGSFEGVRLITDKSIDKLKDEKVAEYIEHLGEPISGETTKIYDISDVYPYTEDDYLSYYQTVVNILKEEVMMRTQTYDGIKTGVEERDFDTLKNTGIVSNFQKSIDTEGGLVEQVMPYIKEMDKLMAINRVNLEMEPPKYTTLEGDVEEVAEYAVPKKMTVQEIMSIEPTSDLYIDPEEDKGDTKEEQETEKTEEVDSESSKETETE